MPLSEFVRQGQTFLRYGYTTGSCATLGAKACGRMLLSGKMVNESRIMTPKGISVEVCLEEVALEESFASCTVVKDGGDDIDVTHGAKITTKVRLLPEKTVKIVGGKGVGTVTKVGLDQAVGESAINSTPRAMITKELEEIAVEYAYEGGFLVEISVPEGESLAEKTFNSKLGIVGGISILGTTGIVEPRSNPAFIRSIETEIRMYRCQGYTDLILTFGEYGNRFLNNDLSLENLKAKNLPMVQMSNFVGEALDCATVEGFRQILILGHAGKMVKLAAGIMNTHSRFADGRREIFTAYTGICGGNRALQQELMLAVSSDASFDLLEEANLLEPVVAEILSSAENHVNNRVDATMKVGLLMFSNQRGELGRSDLATELLEEWKTRL